MTTAALHTIRRAVFIATLTFVGVARAVSAQTQSKSASFGDYEGVYA